MARRLDVPRLCVDDRKVGGGAPRRTRKSVRDNISIKQRTKARQGRNVPITVTTFTMEVFADDGSKRWVGLLRVHAY